jgi:predicted DsbA family dithiol-disulfide isomerase
VAESAGLEREGAAAAIADPALAQDVRAETEYWMDRNVTGVPAFIINGKFMIPGAQDADTLVAVIERVLEKEAAAA